ncbi:hypothetical protein TrST_g8682 [Triparma strigata]|uniref:Acetyl-CoA carboxylase n=1 Tax=Triparma strigata TaxID=1606541 RepID=A0A9W7ECA3_9STRA|nr:hypothetical protein TrST_g8682 [Triparma strigata]
MKAALLLLLLQSVASFNLPGYAFAPKLQQPASTATNAPQAPVASKGWGSLFSSQLFASTLEPETTSQGSQALDDYVKARGGSRPIKKVLIANNGMAATKSILSMRQWAYMELGDENAIKFVAMATPEDLKANAEFVRLADSFVEVPAGKNSNNYANVDVIVKIAKEQGVDAVWPGWGHASENPALPNTLNAMGIKFIGPTGPVMSVLGDKIAANILAQTAKVPSIPWSGSYGGPDDGPLQADLNEEGTIPLDIFEKATCRTVEEAVEAAKKIGYENGIMIKASEGGGGKGIRFVDNEDDLRNAYVQVQNEVIGSPIFLMQLCKNARHLEVQIVGDEHGNAVALNGRDCSTQRRFQKIFEEGPPIIAPVDTFREMERAAQRLTQSIGYIGAGTVEYLYNADTGNFFFLELNPRLQVEHPVTEGITLVNLPATQLQVAMGIPLNQIPEVRKFYGLDMYGDSKIDFLEEDYKPIDTHVIAARITAENPDEGFKPTSGSIERIKFQSTSNVWGYFSVGANGGIHEFADSQFGHLFAKGPTREHARKSLVLALKEIEVRGEIRTTVEYLVELLETDEFKQNTIDTSWLDGILKEKSVSVTQPPHLVVTSAAIYRAFEHINKISSDIKESLTKGQTSLSDVNNMNAFPVEIAYLDTKYNFDVTRLSPDVMNLAINGQNIQVKIRENPDGSLVANFGGEPHRIVGMDEPLGLRLSLDGVTILMPTIFDPSELRSDVTGKVVRFLQEPGTEVVAGEPYVEVEAMKMIMPIKATESGTIAHNMNPGSIISAGDLVASLSLKDPSKVKKILTFTESLDIEEVPILDGGADAVNFALAGYPQDVEAAAASSLETFDDIGSASSFVAGAIQKYLSVETQFDGLLLDDVVRDLNKANKDDLDVVIDLNMAHQQLGMRNKLILAMLRQVETFVDRFGLASLPEELMEALTGLTMLKSKQYGEIGLAADSIVRESQIPGFEVRKAELRSQLVTADKAELARSTSLSAGVDLLSGLFDDDDEAVASAALEVYIRRIYRAHSILDISIMKVDGQLTANWKFQFADVPAAESPVRHGKISVVKDFAAAQKIMPAMIESMKGGIADDIVDDFVNVLHIAVTTPANGDDEDELGKQYADLFATHKAGLEDLKIRTINVLVAAEKKNPKYFSYPQCQNFEEDPLRRNMRPTFHHLLELSRLTTNHKLVRLDAVGKNAQVYLGSEMLNKPVRGGPPQVVFVRALSHSSDVATSGGATRALLQGLDELERAISDARVSETASSRIFLHSLPEIETTPEEVAEVYMTIMDKLKSRFATRLLKLRVDEIEVKLRCKIVEDGKSVIKPVRLIASSMSGEWLKVSAYNEYPDVITGVTQEFCALGTEDKMCTFDPYGTSNIVQTKRAIARRVGSTYAYDFLGLLEVGLVDQWDTHLKALASADITRATDSMPSAIFRSDELLFDENKNLIKGTRDIGSNKIGMVAWHTVMKTPEYPEGRDVVFIANDVTVQSGSFGVDEDDFYFAASEYARKLKIPRVYIACNAGARIGLVEELKPKFQVKFTDANNPAKGFDYLYLTDEDYKGLDEGVVNAEKCPDGWKIIDIIGTKEGIGVENLRGSGMIAGETSRAYDEIFTLSYVTGRSVGIGAYIVRLGQRVIQMKQGPMILTGFSALNKLLGKEVYTSQDQLGGPQVMHPNGVTHEVVDNDQEGVASILTWLSYVAKDASALPAVRESADPVERDVEFLPTKTPYDPRHMLAGTSDALGFFDKGSFNEYLSGWGKSVVTGRARLGGIPVGVIAVETRLVEQRIPADPANPESREAILPQAGQVWFPDSSHKTAQAIRDFGNSENLPLMIFANWRGFSGGTRDMAGEILKFGAMIVDALREYKHPAMIYIPPHGELRGGSWVVVDPTINLEQMEMYADVDSRGGILEPPGICEVKFRQGDQLAAMHRTDQELIFLDAELDGCQVDSDALELKAKIKERENMLLPLYLQVAHEFADLHDRSGRMKAKGVIRDVVTWPKSRQYFHYRIKRRIVQDDLVDQFMAADEKLSNSDAVAKLSSMVSGDFEDDKLVLSYFSDNEAAIQSAIGDIRKAAITAKIAELQAML